MNMRKFAKVVSAIVAVVLVIGMMPVMALAASFDTAATGDYFSVISENKYNLCSGATEVELILNNADGNDRKVVHYFEVDTKNPNIEVLPGYYGIDKLDPNNLPLDGIADKGQYWKAMELTKTVKYYEDMGYNVVGAMNTALAYDSNAPYGYMVMNGVVLGTPEVHKGAQTYLAIDAEGNCELRSMSTPLNGTEVTAISANFNWLVKDGKLQKTNVERTSSDASRSMIGIKADGSLIFCQVDGRNAPVSTGLSDYEMGEMMLALGCVNAVNCDGGGSSTFVSKREGESSNTMRSIPSDGSERPTINSVILVSKAKSNGEFDHAVLKSDYDFYAPFTSAAIKPQGVDAAGGPAEMPTEGITWGLSDASFGTIADGVFVSNGKKGDVTIQMFYNGAPAGEKTIHVVDPDVFALNLDETVLPYGKTMTIDFSCTYGVDDWAVCMDGAYKLTLSDNAAAALVGNTLIAPTDETITGVTVTATYIPNPAITDTLKVTYGKGSEIVWNFEDGDRAGFMGFQEAKKWSQDNGVTNSLVGEKPLDGQFNPEIGSTTFIADAAKGDPVHSGNHALAWSLDYTDADYAGWSYNILFNVNDRVVFRDVENGQNATALGMWLYIPEGAAGLSFQSQFYGRAAGATTWGCHQAHFMFTTVSGARKNLNSCTEADIPESRWVYVSIDLSGYDYLSTMEPHATAANVRSPSFIRCYIKPTVPAVHTFYIDDITLDYSSAVDDRVLPTIGDVSYTTEDMAVILNNGASIKGNTVTFTATVSDNIKLDNASGKIFVDGNLISGSAVSGKFLLADAVTLTPGVHTVSYEVKDTMGNLARVTRTFTIEGDAAVTLGGHNDSGLKPEYDSIYYVDVNVADIKNVNKLTTTLKLQTANTWEPIGISVAKGFKVSYTLNTTNDELTLVIERNGEAVDASATTLVSVPVRLWLWDAINNVTGLPVAPETQYATGYCPIVSVDCKVLYGNVEYADKTYGAFGGKISVETMINDTVNPWHVHDAELTVLNKDVTCTEDGYANRTYCEGCKSVIDWGTIYKATGHTYEVVDGRLACDCGEAVTSSGLLTINGNTYYAVVGKLATGWIADGSNYYYMDPVSYAALTDGRYNLDGFWYSFDENGIHTEGQWVHLFYNGKYETRYKFAGKYINQHFHEIDGKTYYFGSQGILVKGSQVLQLTDGVDNKYIYIIDDDGVVDGVLDYTGVYDLRGTLYYVVNGKLTGGGLMDINGARYYVAWNGLVSTGKFYVMASNTNGLGEAGWYYFAEDGKMLSDVFYNVDGEICYIVNGQPAKGLGVIEYNGGLYYVDGMGRVCSGKIYVTENYTNGLVDAGYLYTDADGRIYDNEYATIDGVRYFMIKGQPEKAGASALRVVDGNLYYFQWNGVIATGKVYIDAEKAAGLTTAGWHYTDETGRFYNDEFVTIDGNIFYMVNGKPEATGTTAVREINGNLYYIRYNGVVETGKFYIEEKYAAGYTVAGWHYTDETGRLYNNEVVNVDGTVYYFVNGRPDATGATSLRVINGNLYYVRFNGIVATGKIYVEDKNANGLTTAGWHYTDETGRLYSNEIVDIDGTVYYLVNGKPDATGATSLRMINGNLYYVRFNGTVATGKVYVEAKNANGYTVAGWHYTDALGRFYNNEFYTIDGTIFYMVNGRADNTGASAIRFINGAYYYVSWNGAVSVGKVYTADGWKYTDATGRFYNDEFVEIDGKLYFFQDGSIAMLGVFMYEGNLYFANTWNGIIARDGQAYVSDEASNGLIIYGFHTFDADGKMIG